MAAELQTFSTRTVDDVPSALTDGVNSLLELERQVSHRRSRELMATEATGSLPYLADAVRPRWCRISGCRLCQYASTSAKEPLGRRLSSSTSPM